MSFRDLFELRKAIARQFLHGAKIDDLTKRYGGTGTDIKKILLLEIPKDEYKKMCRERHGIKDV